MSTGKAIKSARTKAGMTQKELADKLGIPFQSVSQWERDERKPKLETLKRIAEAIGIDVLSIADFDTSSEILADDINQKEKDYGENFFPLMSAFCKLNDSGQKRAVELLFELAEIPKYQCTKCAEDE